MMKRLNEQTKMKTVETPRKQKQEIKTSRKKSFTRSVISACQTNLHQEETLIIKLFVSNVDTVTMTITCKYFTGTLCRWMTALKNVRRGIEM